MGQVSEGNAIPTWVWMLLILSPIDLLPDWVLGPVGFIDDIFYIYMAIKQMSQSNKPAIGH